MTPTVYLAGPIRGLSYGDSTDWRGIAKTFLAEHDITAYSPLRGKGYLAGATKLADDHGHISVLSGGKGVTTRDRWDATRCDLLFANVLGATMVSIGTVMELAWADSARVPIILCMEEGNAHQHIMVAEVAGYVVPTLEDGLQLAVAILCDDPSVSGPLRPDWATNHAAD